MGHGTAHLYPLNSGRVTEVWVSSNKSNKVSQRSRKKGKVTHFEQAMMALITRGFNFNVHHAKKQMQSKQLTTITIKKERNQTEM